MAVFVISERPLIKSAAAADYHFVIEPAWPLKVKGVLFDPVVTTELPLIMPPILAVFIIAAPEAIVCWLALDEEQVIFPEAPLTAVLVNRT